MLLSRVVELIFINDQACTSHVQGEKNYNKINIEMWLM